MTVKEKDQGQKGSQFCKQRNEKKKGKEDNMEEWNLYWEGREL